MADFQQLKRLIPCRVPFKIAIRLVAVPLAAATATARVLTKTLNVLKLGLPFLTDSHLRWVL